MAYLTSAMSMILIVAVIAPLPGTGTPLRASFSRSNVVLNTSLATVANFDDDACAEDGGVDVRKVDSEVTCADSCGRADVEEGA